MTMNANSNTNDMSTSSEERRRTEAALVRAIDMDASVDAAETRAAVCRYVDLLADDGLLPEAVVIAFKSALAGAESLQQFEADQCEALRSALVSACIERYFTRHVADDVRVVGAPALRLVRDELEPQPRAGSRDASA
jgi:hypothetical protein